MVWKSVDRIKKALPEVIHIIMFYNNGMVYQTTFEHKYNIPKIGENLAELISRVKSFYDLCEYNFDNYNKIIIETDDLSCVILKLGEDSNIALFLKKEIEINQKLKSIRRYIKRIELLIDTGIGDLEFQELKMKEEEIKELEAKILEIQSKIKDLNELQKVQEGNIDKKKELSKEIEKLMSELTYLEPHLELKKREFELIEEQIKNENG